MIDVVLAQGAMEQSVEVRAGERLAAEVADISTTGYRWQLLPPAPLDAARFFSTRRPRDGRR